MDLQLVSTEREREGKFKKKEKTWDGDETKGREEGGKVINFVMPILLCSASVSTPFTFVIARVHKIIRTAGRGGRGMKESSGAQRRDKIEGRPVTDLMAARLSIPGFRAATDNSVMRLHSAFTGGKNVPLNFNLSGPFIWPSPLFKFYICL